MAKSFRGFPTAFFLIHVIVGGMLAFPFHLAMFTTRIPSRMAERLECAGSLDLL
jgi:hypothetical protein